MNTDTINHNALMHLSEAGAISSAKASADGDTWTLRVTCGEQNKTVMAKNSGKPRVWRKLDTLTKYLQSIGIKKFSIDATHYDADKKSLKRPDSSAILKRTHQAHKSQGISTLIKPKRNELIPTETLEQTREKWEERRARILAEENPRVE